MPQLNPLHSQLCIAGYAGGSALLKERRLAATGVLLMGPLSMGTLLLPTQTPPHAPCPCLTSLTRPTPLTLEPLRPCTQTEPAEGATDKVVRWGADMILTTWKPPTPHTEPGLAQRACLRGHGPAQTRSFPCLPLHRRHYRRLNPAHGATVDCYRCASDGPLRA